jgi:O-antigen/teichoic acid export membrane protein
MLKRIKSFSKEELVKGSLVLFIMINLFNFLNYVFHFLMARILGPADYGLLAVLMSMAYIFSVPNEALQTVASSLTSKFNSKKEFGKMNFVFAKIIKKYLRIAALCFVLFIPIAFFLSYFLPGVTFLHLIFTGTILFGVFTVPVVRGVLQGRKKFKKLGWSMVIESVAKLVIAVSLVLLGMRIYGAMAGVIFSIFLSFLLSLTFIKEVTGSKKKKVEDKNLYSYNKPIIIAVFVVMIMFSLDIILAKRFFDSDLAGKYAVASMLGKMIFLGVIPIGKAMFPIASEAAKQGKKSKSFQQSLILVSVLCLIAVAAFFIIPKVVIGVLFGQQYVDIWKILGFIGLAFSFLAFSNLVILYLLSRNKIKRPSLLVIFPIIQILLLFLFHETLLQFTLAFMLSNIFLLIFSLFILFKK